MENSIVINDEVYNKLLLNIIVGIIVGGGTLLLLKELVDRHKEKQLKITNP